ncbi:allatostatin-A receptor-like [Glandiceps talaboti]
MENQTTTDFFSLGSEYSWSYDDSDFIEISPENINDHVVSDADSVILTVVMPIVFIIGCTGNILTIFVILKLKEMRTVTNYFLVNLAIADSLFLVMVVPPKFVMHIIQSIHLKDNWNLVDLVGCKLFSYVPRVAQGVSCFIILTLTIERYFAICWPFKLRTIRTKRKAVFVNCALWVLAAVFALPHVYFPTIYEHGLRWAPPFNNTELPSSVKKCYPCSVGKCDYYIIYSKVDEVLFLFIVPVLVVLYVLMLMTLHKAAQFGRAAKVKSSNSMAAKRQLIRMLGVTVTVYLICVGSFRVFTLMMVFDRTYYKHTTVLNVTRVLLYINEAINPIIYNIFSRMFRSAFIKVLRCKRKSVHPGNESSSDNFALTTTTVDWYRSSIRSFRGRRIRSRKSSQRNESFNTNGAYRQKNGSCRRQLSVERNKNNGSIRKVNGAYRDTIITLEDCQ